MIQLQVELEQCWPPGHVIKSLLLLMVALSFPPIFWIIAFFLISYISMPSCVKDCNREFANNAALSRHHKACPILKIVRQRSQDIRRDKGIGKSTQDVTGLLTRKQRLMVCSCSFFEVFYLRSSGTFKLKLKRWPFDPRQNGRGLRGTAGTAG